MKSLFTRIDSSNHTAVSSAQVLNLFIYFIVIHLSQIRYSVCMIPFRDSGFCVLVLPRKCWLFSIYTFSFCACVCCSLENETSTLTYYNRALVTLSFIQVTLKSFSRLMRRKRILTLCLYMYSTEILPSRFRCI